MELGTRNLRRLVRTLVSGGAMAGLMAGVMAGVMAGPAQARMSAAEAEAAAAAGVTGRVATSGLLLNARSGPSTTRSSRAMLPHGSVVRIVCQQAGELVKGKVRTTRLWDRLADGTFVSDGFVIRGKVPVRCERLAVPGGQIQPPATRRPDVQPSGWTSPIPGAAGSGFRTKARPTHDGVDIAARRKTVIHAAAAGRVITAECNASTNNCNVDGSPRVTGCGWYVEIQHTRRLVTRYCHMVKRPSVRVGQKVRAGQTIGYVGSSGNSSGPHLHFEVHKKAAPATSENAINPVRFLKSRGVKLR